MNNPLFKYEASSLDRIYKTKFRLEHYRKILHRQPLTLEHYRKIDNEEH